MKDLIVKNAFCSQYIQKVLTIANNRSSLYKLVKPPGNKTLLFNKVLNNERNIHGRMYHVQRKIVRLDNKSNYIHKVFIPDDVKEWPSADHRKFKVGFFPTGHIARVYQELNQTFLSKATLHPQWHLQRHPLYESTHQLLFTDNSQLPVLKRLLTEKKLSDKANNQTDRDNIIDVKTFHDLNYPKGHNKRYCMLHGAATRLIEMVQNNVSLYKKTMIQLTSLLQDADTEINGGTNLGTSVMESHTFQVQLPLPPTLSSELGRRGIVGKQSLANMSNVSYGSSSGHSRRIIASTAQIKKNMNKAIIIKNKNKNTASVCANTSSVCTNTKLQKKNTH